MKITFGTAFSLHEAGIRERQEDAIMPPRGTSEDNEKCFVICDGLGGHRHGDMASQTVAESVYNYITGFPGAVTEECIKAAVETAYTDLDRLANGNNDYSNIGTTLTCVCLTEEGFLAAHIGDSRIYHIRPKAVAYNGILYRSWDDSLVNLMVKLGQITEEESLTHPERNVLLKAMMPVSSKRFTPNIYKSADLCPGDYLFLCSDGVNGVINDNELFSIIADSSLSDTEKINRIASICSEISKDNYSCWLIPIIFA